MRGWTRGGLAKQVLAKNAGRNGLEACHQQMWHSPCGAACGVLSAGLPMPWWPRPESRTVHLSLTQRIAFMSTFLRIFRGRSHAEALQKLQIL